MAWQTGTSLWTLSIIAPGDVAAEAVLDYTGDVAAGDIIVLQALAIDRTTDDNWVTPSGFTEAMDDNGYAVFWKVADGSEGNDITIALESGTAEIDAFGLNIRDGDHRTITQFAVGSPEVFTDSGSGDDTSLQGGGAAAESATYLQLFLSRVRVATPTGSIIGPFWGAANNAVSGQTAVGAVSGARVRISGGLFEKTADPLADQTATINVAGSDAWTFDGVLLALELAAATNISPDVSFPYERRQVSAKALPFSLNTGMLRDL
jgi:hypothetical protein